jgi:hypothetical protein
LSSLASRIEELRRRAEAVAAELINIAARRKQHSLDAAIGDKGAIKSIADLDAENDSLKKEAMTISSALEMAEQREREEQQEAEARERHAREVDAYRAARAVITLQHEIDEALLQLRQIFERRAIALNALGNVVDHGLVTRLSNKSNATSAAQLAGLSKYLNLEMTPAGALRPLASSDEILLRIGVDPDKDRGQFATKKVPH